MPRHFELDYCADTAKFSMPFTQLGLCSEFGSSLLFTQLADYPRAVEKLLLGDAFTAQEAFEMGLVSKVLSAEELLPFAQKQAARLIALLAASVRTKKTLKKQPRLERRWPRSPPRTNVLAPCAGTRNEGSVHGVFRKAEAGFFNVRLSGAVPNKEGH